jgi:hypothetical protein
LKDLPVRILSSYSDVRVNHNSENDKEVEIIDFNSLTTMFMIEVYCPSYLCELWIPLFFLFVGKRCFKVFLIGSHLMFFKY